MAKFLTTILLLALLGGTIYLLTQSKEAYKVLPDINKQMEADPYGLWRNFDEPNHHFVAAFPVVPQHATDHIKDVMTKQTRQYDMYVASQSDGSVFLIRLITYPKEAKLSHVDLVNSINYDLVQSHAGNQLLSSTDTTFAGHEAIKFAIASDPNRIEGVAFTEGQALFLIAVMANKESFSQADHDHFLNSFKLTSPK